MYAIIRLKGGMHYTSLVFGNFFKAVKEFDYMTKEKECFLVLNKEKTRLVKQYIFNPHSHLLDPAIIITDGDQSDWKLDDKGFGCIDFLSDLAPENIESEIPPALLRKCIELDAACHYCEYQEIKTAKDIDDLMWATGEFHDAYIDKLEERPDGSLYVIFEGIWGCTLEVWFEGDVAYSTKNRDPQVGDPYWFSSTIILQDGFVYLIDDEDMTVEEDMDGYSWFKARSMKYRIIPKGKFSWEKKARSSK